MFAFANAAWLLALPLPVLIWLLLQRRAPRNLAALFHPHAELLARLAADLPQIPPRIAWLWLAGCMMFILALGRPQWISINPDDYPGRDMMFAIDVSGSMRAEDFLIDGKPANRLAMVKATVDQLLAQRKGDRAGLIIFGDEAYTMTPVTQDLNLLRKIMLEIKNGMAGEKTALGNAVVLAVKLLSDRPKQSRILFLFTDGTNTTGQFGPSEALVLAQQYRVRIYPVGIGKSGKVAFPGGPSGETISSELPLDEEELIRLAEGSGGRYHRVQDSEDVTPIIDDIEKLETVDIHPETVGKHTDWYWLPLVLGLALLLVAQRRGVKEVLP